MTDPRDFDRRMDMGGMDRPLEMEHRMGSPTPWGWIAGAVFVIVMLALVFSGSESTRTANNDASPPAATTHRAAGHYSSAARDHGPRRTARPITAIHNNRE